MFEFLHALWMRLIDVAFYSFLVVATIVQPYFSFLFFLLAPSLPPSLPPFFSSCLLLFVVLSLPPSFISSLLLFLSLSQGPTLFSCSFLLPQTFQLKVRPPSLSDFNFIFIIFSQTTHLKQYENF